MTSALVELARQGDEEAIAQLLNHALQAQHIDTTVVFDDGYLKLGLESATTPAQEELVPLVVRGLLKLQIPGVRTVTLMARELGGAEPDWIVNFTGHQRGLLKGLAEWGDEGAIAQLLNKALAHKQITTQVQLKDEHLILTLHADPLPDQRIALTLLQRELASWSTQRFQVIEVRGQRSKSSQPEWMTSFTPQAVAVAAVKRTPGANVQKTRAPKSPAVWTFKFNYPKLALISLLAFYGLFCARDYNFDDFVNGTNPLMGFIHGVNLIFHEAGHTIFSMFGQLIHLLAGSAMQIAVPAFMSGYFFFTRQSYAGAVALCWVGENFWDVSIYIKDAQEQALPLLGGENVLHDWHFILVMLWQLKNDDAIGNTAYGIGTLIYAFAVFLGIFYAQIQPKSSNEDA
ncbi:MULTISPECIES: hypothetical protein [unclassified Leptolyngbya]|uniref:hypothetical protein n=1 Tax=unclassified Leptolyngbya TaxID=2650499 RepID=UPI001681D9E3|nr:MULTISPECIES: hypothetical protein [unclassified Leptolyngbya]MBD1909539.1 hypothetical protein [Leptolyngbya sp. FACHB-8]MBD2154615.1 hypothetical protein [Leptolyngbya sp. FACHB-16]